MTFIFFNCFGISRKYFAISDHSGGELSLSAPYHNFLSKICRSPRGTWKTDLSRSKVKRSTADSIAASDRSQLEEQEINSMKWCDHVPWRKACTKTGANSESSKSSICLLNESIRLSLKIFRITVTTPTWKNLLTIFVMITDRRN